MFLIDYLFSSIWLIILRFFLLQIYINNCPSYKTNTFRRIYLYLYCLCIYRYYYLRDYPKVKTRIYVNFIINNKIKLNKSNIVCAWCNAYIKKKMPTQNDNQSEINFDVNHVSWEVNFLWEIDFFFAKKMHAFTTIYGKSNWFARKINLLTKLI